MPRTLYFLLFDVGAEHIFSTSKCQRQSNLFWSNAATMIVTLQYYEGLSVLRAFRFRALEGAWAECKGWVEFSRHKAETRRVRYVLPCVLRRIGPSTQYVPDASHIASLTGASRYLEFVTRMWRRFNPKERRVISVRSCIQKPCRSCCFFAITHLDVVE